MLEQGRKSPARGRDELVVRRASGSLHCGKNAASGARDLFVGRPPEPHLELASPVASEHQVRVAIDESGSRPAPLRVQSLLRITDELRGSTRCVTQPRDTAFADDEHSIAYRAVRLFSPDHRREVHVGDQQVTASQEPSSLT